MVLRAFAFHFDRYITSATDVLHPTKRFCMIRYNLPSCKKGTARYRFLCIRQCPFPKNSLIK